MAREQLAFGVFQDALGNPLALGYLTVRLNTDAVASDGSQVAAGRVVTVPLDDNGLIDGAAEFWPNSQLTPSGTSYIIKAFTAEGQFVWQTETTAIDTQGLILQEDSFFIVLEDGSGFVALE